MTKKLQILPHVLPKQRSVNETWQAHVKGLEDNRKNLSLNRDHEHVYDPQIIHIPGGSELSEKCC